MKTAEYALARGMQASGFAMRSVGRLLWLFALWVLPILGCNEVYTPTTAPITVTVGTGPPLQSERVLLEGVRVCEMDSPSNCEETDARGEAILVLPVERETGFTLDKEGYASWLVGTVIEAKQTTLGTNMVTAQHIADGHDRVMSPYPMRGTGTVGLQLQPGFAGATFELVAATGTAWYMDEDFNWSPDLTETKSIGIGGFAEITPGEAQVRVGGAADGCISLGWPGGEVNLIRAPIREGYVTLAGVTCPPP